jgi:plastocyanin
MRHTLSQSGRRPTGGQLPASWLVISVALFLYLTSAALADTPSHIQAGSVKLGPGQRVPRGDLKKLHLPAGRPPTATGSNSTVYYSNWSGYAATGSKTFNQVESTFIQPTVSCPVAGAFTVFWVGFDGFDGFDNGTVEQAGTAAQCSGGASPQPTYYGWWEMYPTNDIQAMPISIHTGDTVNAVVSYLASSNTYALTVADRSDQQTYTQTTTCAADLTCGRDSAEWIVERPGVGGAYTPLADWGTMQLGADSASDAVSSGGGYVPQAVSAFTNTPIDMVDNSDTAVLATVGPLGTSGNIFTDTVNDAANFTTTPSPATVGTPVTFDASSSTCAAAPCTYAWSDGTAKLGAGTKLTYTFHYAGTKHVLLTLTDARGGKSTVEHDLQVGALATAARFTTSPSSPVTVGTQVTFDASSSTCAAAPCTYAWSDGTAKLGAGTKLTYTFHYAGTKHVLLTLTDARGGKSSVEHDLTVS